MLQLFLISLVFRSSAMQTDSPVVELTRRENVTKLKQVLARGEDPDARAGREGTALHIAAKKGNLLLVMALVDAEATIDARDGAGQTPLMIAASDGFFPVVQILQEAGADVNAVDSEGISALMLAAKNGHLTIVKFLLRQDADLHLADNQGANAYDRVRLEGDEMSKDIAKLLRALGAQRGKDPDKPANMIFVDKELAEPGEDGVYDLSELKNNKKREKGDGPIFLNDDMPNTGNIVLTADYQSKRPDEADAALNAIDLAIQQELYQDALTATESMLAKDLDPLVRIYGLYQLFQSQIALGQDQTAMSTLAKLKDADPEPTLLYSLVMQLAKQYHYKTAATTPDYQRAEQCFTWAMELNPQSPWEALHGLMNLYLTWERYHDALKVYRKVASANPPPFAKERFEKALHILMSVAPPVVRDENGGLLTIGPYDFSAFRGKVVVVANWSPDYICTMDLMAALKRLYRRYEDHLEIITVPASRNLERVKEVIAHEKFIWKQVFENSQPLVAGFEMRRLPTAVIIDHRGQSIYHDTPCREDEIAGFYVDVARAAKRARKAAKQKAKQD